MQKSATVPPSESEDALSGASIRVVSNRTGIAADTLRMWERRYGFPRPARRPGGSRVYSEDDVARLHLVARAINAGFRPSEVVTLPSLDLTKLVEASAADAPMRAVAGQNGRASATSQTVPAPTIDGVTDALCADDIVRVRALLRAAAVSLGPRSFVTELAHPLAVRVGELWAEGKLEVRHEHVASACLTSQLHLLLGALEDGDRSPSSLLATLPGEPHQLGLDMVAVYLAANLAAPHVLGPDTPPPQIVSAARAFEVDAVGVSISPAADRRVASRAVKMLAESLPGTIDLWLGGAGAQGVAASAPSATLTSTWTEVDEALSDLRTRLRKA
jgi:DNA-binding transcriptional MerR regulator/methylmalonyl-CoA mutase cobalamin-binding subunit